ncbi:MAG TPA: glycerol-3-phosphate dehydrogenase [Phycisphaerales bacterium]|nr:glycerol-3-phosphate dehydrogenase [Phycisphaerales bacterium]HCD31867.1 glycerol-3-phosphate dehydrogenase [Phycisphaerales bacterium]
MGLSKVCIIGTGSMGTVTALMLQSQGLDVTLWGAFETSVTALIQTRENKRHLPGFAIPPEVHITSDLHQAVNDVDLVVSTVPTQHVRSVWERLAPAMTKPTPIVSMAKGIEIGTLLRPTQILKDTLQKAGAPIGPLGAISGPTIAEELARCLPATVIAASEDEAFAQELQKTFTCNWFRVYTLTDLMGVELAGATKNVIALAAGILDGLQAGNNAKSALLARGLAEILRLGTAMGADHDTFFGIAGIGDLATTCFSPTGRNRSCGEKLGQGQTTQQILDSSNDVVEGIPTTQAVMQLAQQYNVEMPITQAVHRVLFENLDPITAISQLMNRELKSEQV